MIEAISANQKLAMQWRTFAGGERHVQLLHMPADIAAVDITLNFENSDDIVDLALLVNALRHQYSPIDISLSLPYLPYARQDRVCSPGQAFSLEVLAQLIRSLALSCVTTWDCHSDVGVKLLGADNIAAEQVIACSPDLVRQLQASNTVLICPDKGAIRRCHAIQKAFAVQDIVLCEKTRNPETGKISETRINRQTFQGKTCVITDDICDGGYTFIKIAELLKARGASRVVLYVTHGIFSKGLDVFNDLIDVVYTSNSLPHRLNDSRLNVIQFSQNTTGRNS